MSNSSKATNPQRKHMNLQDMFAKATRAESGCIEWQGVVLNNGYGQQYINGKMVSVHRYVAKLVYGEPADGLFAMHSCDNKKCINPDHLRWGTHRENTDEAMQRNRYFKGEINAFSKLKEIDIPVIKSMYAGGMKKTHIGNHFNVSRQCIHNVLIGKTWSWLEEVRS